jgi:hypothetical protein
MTIVSDYCGTTIWSVTLLESSITLLEAKFMLLEDINSTGHSDESNQGSSLKSKIYLIN